MDDRGVAVHEGIRAVLGPMPRLVTDILRRALTDARIDVVVLNGAPREWSQADLIADVVIVPTELTELAAWGCDLLRSRARIKILSLSTSADHADLYELRLVGSNVGVQGVVAAVRSAADVIQ